MCQELAGVDPGTGQLGEVQRRCIGGEREGEAEWSPVDISECGLSITALRLCENSLNMVTIIAPSIVKVIVIFNGEILYMGRPIAQCHNTMV